MAGSPGSKVGLLLGGEPVTMTLTGRSCQNHPQRRKHRREGTRGSVRRPRGPRPQRTLEKKPPTTSPCSRRSPRPEYPLTFCSSTPDLKALGAWELGYAPMSPTPRLPI